MKKKQLGLLCIVVLLVSSSSFSQEKTSHSPAYAPVHKYDPKRDAEKDIHDALAEARRSGKRVLLEVGGEWCGWCHAMDRFFDQNPGLVALRERSYVTVKINMSPENRNTKVLSQYPEVPGYPHIFVLEQDGKLLHSQDTDKLEAGKSYDLVRFTEFLKKWSQIR